MKFIVKTRRLIILGVIFLATLAALVEQYNIMGVALGGLLALLKDDKEEGE